MKPRMIGGLDIGQSRDPSALVILEQTSAIVKGKPVPMFETRLLQRIALGTPYPEQVNLVKGLYERAPLRGSVLCIDATGVGAAVRDQFAVSGIKATISAWSITAGRKPGAGTVPKCDLVAAVQTVLGQRRLKIAKELPGAEVLAKELEMFRVKVTADRIETFSSWRERDHDDLVLALALAVWYGERLGVPQGGKGPSAHTPPCPWGFDLQRGFR